MSNLPFQGNGGCARLGNTPGTWIISLTQSQGGHYDYPACNTQFALGYNDRNITAGKGKVHPSNTKT